MPKTLWLLVLLSTSSCVLSSSNVRRLCQGVEASKSCAQCIQQHPECAWCEDELNITQPFYFRCDRKKDLERKCEKIASPESSVAVPPQDNPLLGSPVGEGVVQLYPKKAYLKMRPGKISEVHYKYMHRKGGPKDAVILTSDTTNLGIGVDFFIKCKGKRIQGKMCPNLEQDETVDFTLKVSLNECRKQDDIAVSIGIGGYNQVSALYITPLCSCECQKIRNIALKSASCSDRGDLICGKCECVAGFGGNNCSCSLARENANTADELENRCRKTPSSPICEGKGWCDCGRCVCDNSFTMHSKFCDCSPCPLFDGKMCAGQGECICGTCRCEPGYEGIDCSCPLSTDSCMEEGLLCNDHGKCECGKCVCNEGYTGLTCGIADEEGDDEGEAIIDVGGPMEKDEVHTGEDPVLSAEHAEGPQQGGENTKAAGSVSRSHRDVGAMQICAIHLISFLILAVVF